MTAAQEVSTPDPGPAPPDPGPVRACPVSGGSVPSRTGVSGPGPVLREDRLDYTPHPHNVAFSRRRAARLIAEWGHPERSSDAALLVSELATNALLHGAVPDRLFRVRLALMPGLLRIEVSDACDERPAGPGARVGAGDETGRGLLIVDRVADRWGAESRTVGKTVFAELDLGQGHEDVGGPARRNARAHRR
ncbi:ATP-binding protein [Streptomyces sp. NPDC047985]|uniref:ATP-binding protein n=1 Tax=Streptomyces sp. NPDC047985 TaxID=3155384 RepID=UPI003438682A